MGVFSELGDWPLIVAVGGLLALHFVNDRRINALERKLADEGEDETGDGDGIDREGRDDG